MNEPIKESGCHPKDEPRLLTWEELKDEVTQVMLREFGALGIALPPREKGQEVP